MPCYEQTGLDWSLRYYAAGLISWPAHLFPEKCYWLKVKKISNGFIHRQKYGADFVSNVVQVCSLTPLTDIALGTFSTATGLKIERYIFTAEKGNYYAINDGAKQHLYWQFGVSLSFSCNHFRKYWWCSWWKVNWLEFLQVVQRYVADSKTSCQITENSSLGFLY